MVDDEAGLERRLAVHPFEHGEEPVDRLVIGRVDAERPFVGREQLDNGFELAFHPRREVRSRLEEVLEIRRRPSDVLAGAVHAQHRRAGARLGHGDPALIVGEFVARLLGEEVVGDPHGELIGVMQPLDDVVVVRIVLTAPARVDHAGDAEPVHLAHVMSCRVDLAFEWQLRPLRQRRIEDERRRLRDQHAGRLAVRILLDQAARGVGCVLGDAEGLERCAVEERTGIEMEEEDRRFGRRRVYLVEGRHAPLGELELRPAADNPHPLRRRRAVGLALEHAERIGERRHILPAQLHIVVEPAADEMCVAIVEAGNDAPATEIDDVRAVIRESHDLFVGANRLDQPIANGDRLGLRLGAVKGRDPSIPQNHFRHVTILPLLRAAEARCEQRKEACRRRGLDRLAARDRAHPAAFVMLR